MNNVELLKNICHEIISHEYCWSEKVVKQANKCLRLISDFGKNVYPKSLLHEAAILASFCASNRPRIEV